MKTKVLLPLLLLVSSCISSTALAEDKPTGSGPNPFSDCGIGAALFPNTDWAAVTSNIIWDIGTTAVTSATASPETCNGKSVATAQYIHRTYDTLVEDVAKGEGEYLSAAFDLVGCAGNDQAAASVSLRQQIATELTSNSYSQKSAIEKSSNFYDALHASVAANCISSINS